MTNTQNEIELIIINFFNNLCSGNILSLDFAREHGDITYIADDGNQEVEYKFCTTPEEAAQEYAEDSDEGEGGVYIIYVYERITVLGMTFDFIEETRDSYEITIDPQEPKCIKNKNHEWETPHHIVGGLKENPGVWGNGGGVIVVEVCKHCSCKKTTDTWATNMQNGNRYTSVSYDTEPDWE